MKDTRQELVSIAQIEDSQEIQKKLRILNHLLQEKCLVRKLILPKNHGFDLNIILKDTEEVITLWLINI